MPEKEEILEQNQNALQGSPVNSSLNLIGNRNTVQVFFQVFNLEILNFFFNHEIKATLKNLYKKLTIPQVAWLNEGLGMDFNRFYMTLELDSDKTTTQIEKIFPSPEPWWMSLLFWRKSPVKNRILIEAPPGYGKTTICTKLMYDWALGKPYLQQYQLAFKIALKNLPNGGLDEALSKICGMPINRVHSLIKSNGDRVLIVLDGYDELAESKKILILPLLFEKNYPKATVIMTSRSGECNITKKQLENALGESALMPQFQDATYRILGLNPNNVETFLSNLKIGVANKVNISRLQLVININPQLFECPLFVILLTFLSIFGDGVEEINTKIKLYKSLFNCILKRSLSKNEEKYEEIDLFQDPSLNVSSYNFAYQTKLRNFGEIVFGQMKDLNLQFDATPICEEIHKLGFLIKHTEIDMFSRKSHFEAFHRTMLEFFVAYYLWHNFVCNFEVEVTIRKFYFQYVDTRQMPLTLYFFCNLCNREKLLNYLAPYAHLYRGHYLMNSMTYISITNFFESYDRLSNIGWGLFNSRECSTYYIRSDSNNSVVEIFEHNGYVEKKVNSNDSHKINASKLIIVCPITANLSTYHVIVGKILIIINTLPQKECQLVCKEHLTYQRLALLTVQFPKRLKINELMCHSASSEAKNLIKFVSDRKIKRFITYEEALNDNDIIIDECLQSEQFVSVLQILTTCGRKICELDFSQLPKNEIKDIWQGGSRYISLNYKVEFLRLIGYVTCKYRNFFNMCIFTSCQISLLMITPIDIEWIRENCKRFHREINVINFVVLFFCKPYDNKFWDQVAECFRIEHLNIWLCKQEFKGDQTLHLIKRCRLKQVSISCAQNLIHNLATIIPVIQHCSRDITLFLTIQLNDVIDNEELFQIVDYVKKKTIGKLEFICHFNEWRQIFRLYFCDASTFCVTRNSLDNFDAEFVKYCLWDNSENECYKFKYTIKLL